jgi:4-alpha-glucanotransferase
VSTHDLPTVAGVWTGRDHQADSFRPRLARLVGEPWAATAAEASVRAHRALATAPSAVVSATLEDLLLVEERPNRPGTVEDGNWSAALPVPIEDLDANETAVRVIRCIT